MKIDNPKEYWLRLISKEGDEPISAGVQRDCDALWQCQMLAAIGIEETDDSGPLADIFAAIHRTAAGQLASKGPAINQEAPAQQWRGIESAPRDGTRIYAVRFVKDWPASLYHVSTVYWQAFDGTGIWMTEDRNEVDEPTHWTDLPTDLPLPATGADQ